MDLFPPLALSPVGALGVGQNCRCSFSSWLSPSPDCPSATEVKIAAKTADNTTDATR